MKLNSLPYTMTVRQIDKISSDFKNAMKDFLNVEKRLDALKQYADSRQKFIGNFPLDTDYENKELENITEQIVTTNDILLGSIYTPQYYEGLRNAEEAEQEFVENMVTNVDKIESILDEKTIYLKMKMLPPSLHRVIKKAGVRTDYSLSLGKGMLYYMRNIWQQKIMCGADDYLKQFSSINISYLFVYPSTVQKFNVMDSTNHDTKNVQDAICFYLPSGDTGLTCSAHFSTVIDDRIPSGTYITVQPDTDLVLPSKAVVDRWESYWKSTCFQSD